MSLMYEPHTRTDKTDGQDEWTSTHGPAVHTVLLHMARRCTWPSCAHRPAARAPSFEAPSSEAACRAHRPGGWWAGAALATTDDRDKDGDHTSGEGRDDDGRDGTKEETVVDTTAVAELTQFHLRTEHEQP